MDFDPYHLWLSIPPNRRPITHYVLLGLQDFESNPQVIENAADQRMGHVRAFQTGKHADACHEILNQIAKARMCLMNVDSKAEYDNKLRSQLGATENTALVTLEPLDNLATPLEVAPQATPATPLVASQRKRQTQGSFAVFIGAGVMITIAVASLLWFSGILGDGKESKRKQAADASQSDDKHRSSDSQKDGDTDSKKTLAGVKRGTLKPNATPKNTTGKNKSEKEFSSTATKKTPEPTSTANQRPADANQPPEVTALTLYCQKMEAKGQVIKLSPLVSYIDGPRGRGRAGAKGFLIDCEKGWESKSTAWSCDYYRRGSARGIQFIHPFQTGHVLVTVARGMLRVNSPGAWAKEGYLGGKSKVNTIRTAEFDKLMDMEGAPGRNLISVLSPDGTHRLFVNKTLVGETKLDHAVSLSMNKDGFRGKRLPGVLSKGTAGILIGPRDRPANIASQVRFGVMD